MGRAILGQGFRSRIMRERWSDGRNATDKYRGRLVELVKARTTILHAGCGWDKNEVSAQFKTTCTVVGVDLDPRVESMFHSEFHLASLESLPFGQETFDTIFSEYVFEHLADPEQVLRELKRVLKPSGTILILTPNYYSYKTLAARLTPHRFHVVMGRHRYGAGHEADMYPTLYRCNTRFQFEELAQRAGLRIADVQFVTNGPTWFQRVPGLFEIFHGFHLAIDRWKWASQLRCALIVEMRRA
jgi:ubiquinone/menaquinone biosynthesis C-methylase UbiE